MSNHTNHHTKRRPRPEILARQAQLRRMQEERKAARTLKTTLRQGGAL